MFCHVCVLSWCACAPSQAKLAYQSESQKWGLVADQQLCEKADAVAELLRATTLEGHWVRVLIKTGSSKAEVKPSLEKYLLRYAQVKPDMIQPAIKGEVDNIMKK